jgi:ATP-dependent Zn protease
VNEALIFSLQDGRDALRWDDLWQAKLAEEIGLKQPVTYTPREKEMVAIHEAAHAVASYTLEKGETQIQVITIQKREDALGLVSRQEVEDMYLSTQKQLLARMQVSLAGLVAEDIWFGQTTSGPSSDLIAATHTAAVYVGLFGMGKTLHSAAVLANPYLGGDPVQATLSDPQRREEVDAILADCRVRVRTLLQGKRHVVEGVRDALLDREELIGDEIEQVMAELGEREPLPVPVPLPAALGGPPVPNVLGGDGNGRGASDGNGQPGQG